MTAVARSDLILGLIRAHGNGDEEAFGRTVAALVADERAKNHVRAAQRYQRAWDSRPAFKSVGEWKKAAGNTPPSIEVSFPERGLDALVLPEMVADTVRSVVREQRQILRLQQHGLLPRNRMLLVGAPGNGKTSVARALAAELERPLLTIHYEHVVSDLLGQSLKLLTQAFEAPDGPCVLFFDELDSIASDRGDKDEHGELKRLLNNFLLNVDRLDPRVMLVGATNMPEKLDRAIWRRFQMVLELDRPDRDGIAHMIELLEARHDFRVSGRESLAGDLDGFSFSEIEDFVLDCLRRVILDGEPAEFGEAALRESCRQWKQRRNGHAAPVLERPAWP